MRCTPTIYDLIVLTLPPRHRCPLDRMPASRLLLPRSGLERSDFVRWRKAAVQGNDHFVVANVTTRAFALTLPDNSRENARWFRRLSLCSRRLSLGRVVLCC